MGPGGTEKQLDALIRGLDQHQYRPHLCTLRSSYSLFDELEIPKLELNLKSVATPKSFVALKRLAGFCRKHKIQLVQTFFQDPTLIGALLKIGLPVELIGSFRDLGFWRTPFENFKMRLAYPFFDGFVANSQAVKSHFCDSDHIAADKIKVIYNGFRIRPQNGEDVQASAKANLNVGIVGNFNRSVKRIQDFIKASAIVQNAIPNTRFTLVGGGFQEGYLRRLALDLGSMERTCFVGQVGDAVPYVKEFDIGLNTSETEGFSNAIIEYMAHGLPVVATAVGGNLELVKDGINGFLYPVGDYRRAAEKIIRLARDETLRKQMGNRNRLKIANEFSYEKMIRAHQTYYRQLINRVL